MKKKKREMEAAKLPSSAPPIEPKASSSSTTETANCHNLVLHDVLHVPGLSYNILSMHKLDASRKYTIEWLKEETAVIKDRDTRSPLAFTEWTPFIPKFPLIGQAEGVCGTNVSIKSEVFDWSWREKQRWEATHDDSKGYDSAAERAAEEEEDQEFERMLDEVGWSDEDEDTSG